MLARITVDHHYFEEVSKTLQLLQTEEPALYANVQATILTAKIYLLGNNHLPLSNYIKQDLLQKKY